MKITNHLNKINPRSYPKHKRVSRIIQSTKNHISPSLKQSKQQILGKKPIQTKPTLKHVSVYTIQTNSTTSITHATPITKYITTSYSNPPQHSNQTQRKITQYYTQRNSTSKLCPNHIKQQKPKASKQLNKLNTN